MSDVNEIISRKDRRGPIAWMAGNSVASNLIMFVLLIGGIFSIFRIKQEVFPEFDLDIVNVTVPYPGASPEEVEKGIILVIEEAVRGLEGVKKVTATAAEGFGTVSIELLEGEDSNKIYQDVKQEVDRISSFPEDIERPSIALVARKREVLRVVLYGEQNDKVLREMAERVREDLLQQKEISQVELEGVRNFEISVEIPQENLRKYNLTLPQIADRISAASIELPGGGVKTQSGEILVRMKDRRDFGMEFEDIPVMGSPDGTQVRLGKIADVIDEFADTDYSATYNGKNAVMIAIYRIGDQTPLQISTAAKEYIAELRKNLPEGIDVDIQNDMSDVYRERLELMLKNAYIGLALVMLLLGLFLDIRLAFWVMMGIPISFLGSFLFLPEFGTSLNLISMFAFIIALGIVVDDAIVVGENIYENRQQGMGFFKASVKGAREVAMPVTFSILTNIVTFVPLLFVPGIMGKIFRWIPVVVISVFVISLFECLFILPAHLSHKARRMSKLEEWIHSGQQKISNAIAMFIKNVYGPFLGNILKVRYITIAGGVMVLIAVVGYVKSGRMGMTLFPQVESDFAFVTAVLPYGSAVEESQDVRYRLVEAASEVADENGGNKQVKGIFAQVGGSYNDTSGPHVITVRVFLTPSDQRIISTAEFVEKWRQKVGQIAGLQTLTFESDRGGPGAGAAITVELSHRNIDMLHKACEELADELAQYGGVKDIDNGFSPGKQQFDFRLKDQARVLGLSSLDVARQVRAAFYGDEAVRQQRGRNEVRVYVRLPKSQRISEYDLESFLIKTPAGKDIPIQDVVEIDRGRAYTSINRRDGKRTVNVTADVVPRSNAENVLKEVIPNSLQPLVEKYSGLSYGFEGRQADIRESLSKLMYGFAAAMFVIYALLAIPFRSYLQPAIIMISIPFGVIGAVLGHILMGYSLGVISIMGVVALSGVVVNDSLVLIEYANRLHREGHSAYEAIRLAGTRRFRPIILTTLTTFGGLAPMIFETSRQAKMMIPMAISLGYGIVFATLITLMLVPCLYLIIEDIRPNKTDS